MGTKQTPMPLKVAGWLATLFTEELQAVCPDEAMSPYVGPGYRMKMERAELVEGRLVLTFSKEGCMYELALLPLGWKQA